MVNRRLLPVQLLRCVYCGSGMRQKRTVEGGVVRIGVLPGLVTHCASTVCYAHTTTKRCRLRVLRMGNTRLLGVGIGLDGVF